MITINYKTKFPLYKRQFKRENLMEPNSYYAQQFQEITRQSGFIRVRCCFHDDRNPSLSINLDKGYFNCFACGAKGGDILSFHIKRYEMSFLDAAKELGGL